MKTLRSYPFVALTAVLMLFVGFHSGGFQLAVSSASADFGLDKTGMGLLASVQFVSMIAVPILFGLLADRIGKKPVLVISLLFAGIGCILASFSAALLPYAAGVFCLGVGGIVCEGTTSAALSDLYPQQSARFITLCQCFFSIGAITGPIVLQALMDSGLHWKVLYGIYGGALVLCLPLLLRTAIPRQVRTVYSKSTGNPVKILLQPAFFLLFTAMVLYVGLENGVVFFVKTLFELRLDAGHLGAYAISAFWAGTAISRLVSGTRQMTAVRTVTVSFACAALLLAGLALSKSAALSLAVSALAGFSYGPIWSGLVALAAAEAPGRSGSAVSILTTGCGIGGAAYPVLMGFMADRMEIHLPFFLLAGTALAGFVLLVSYWRRKVRHKEAVL